MNDPVVEWTSERIRPLWQRGPEYASLKPKGHAPAPKPRGPHPTFTPAIVREDNRGPSPVNVRGVDESGEVPTGAESWEYREPRGRPTEHAYIPIELNGRRYWQQPPPVHVNGIPFGSPKAHRTIAREVSEREAQRKVIDGRLVTVDLRSPDVNRATLARRRRLA